MFDGQKDSLSQSDAAWCWRAFHQNEEKQRWQACLGLLTFSTVLLHLL